MYTLFFFLISEEKTEERNGRNPLDVPVQLHSLKLVLALRSKPEMCVTFRYTNPKFLPV